ncbi:MAG: carbonic anhydrase, partial [Methyloceanibacter sp.]
MCELCRASRAGLTRRQIVAGGAAVLAASTVPFAASRAADPAPADARNAIAPAAALEEIMQGNARYVANQPVEKDFSAGRAARGDAQVPSAASLGCADSRVSPELLFEQGPGDLFVVRLAGNFLDDDGFASLEYAVKFLGAPLIMVLGHTNCGAV